MEYAIGSMMETQDLIRDGTQRRYFTVERTERARKLVQRALQVSRPLLRYLKSQARSCKSGRTRTSSRFSNG